MGSAEVNAFLMHLAVEGQVSACTQNQALAALLFLYQVLLERDLDLEGVVRAVLERMYGSGLRLMEALRLRVKDLDCDACTSKTLLRGMAVCNSPERSDASTGMRTSS
jgi:site-specific recombinase XerC